MNEYKGGVLMRAVQTNTIKIKDGRTLAYCEYGDLSGYRSFMLMEGQAHD
ncbi:hypothetical protein [Halobacillus sp. K22]